MDYRIILKQVEHDRNIHKRVNQFCVNRKIKTNFSPMKPNQSEN